VSAEVASAWAKTKAPVRILLAKPGLDGHDRGMKVIAMALRDAGVEVIYLGLRRSPHEILRAARDEGVDVIGLSVLSGAHLALCDQIIAERLVMDCRDVPIIVGGTINEEDVVALLEAGIASVFPVGSDLLELVDSVIELGSHGE
jgi:methylmalonyl-CoA mutase C-terminal domain/subunit